MRILSQMVILGVTTKTKPNLKWMGLKPPKTFFKINKKFVRMINY